MFSKKTPGPTTTVSSKTTKSRKTKLLLLLALPLSVLLIVGLSLIPILDQSTASRALDLVGAHGAALGVDSLTRPLSFNYLKNFARLDPELSSCDPLWDAYKDKSAALALAELSALPNVTRLGVEVDSDLSLTNESRVYRNPDVTALALKDMFDLTLDLGSVQDGLELAPADRVEFLDTVFTLDADFHIIGDLVAEEDQPSGYLAINNLELTSQKGFSGNFTSPGYYGIEADLEDLPNSSLEKEQDPRVQKILETPLGQMLSDESGYAVMNLFCAGFERMEIGAPRKKSFGTEERRIRPITFYPYPDMLTRIVRPATAAVEKITQDSTFEQFVKNNVELFACPEKDYQELESNDIASLLGNDSAYASQADCIRQSNEETEKAFADARKNPLRENPEYEQEIQQVLSSLEEIPLVVQPITSYLDMRTFKVAGYDLAVVVTPAEGEPFEKLTLSLGQFKTPDVMPIEIPSEYRSIEQLPNDFMSSSLYKGLEKEVTRALEEFNDRFPEEPEPASFGSNAEEGEDICEIFECAEVDSSTVDFSY